MRLKQILIVTVLLWIPLPVFALEPGEVAVVVNRSENDGVKIARYYMEQRGIPEDNLILIKTSPKETCSRKSYDEEIAGPVRDSLRNRSHIRALVTVFGVPLKIQPPRMTDTEKNQLKGQREELDSVRKQLRKLTDKNGEQDKFLQQKISTLEKKVQALLKLDHAAAVDSELSLVLTENYPLRMWVPNPYFAGFRGRQLPVDKSSVLIVSRLDGPSEKIVRRIIDDSLAVEATGLRGNAYFDARWKKSSLPKELEGNSFYDNSLHLAAERVKKKISKVVVNEQQALFQAGEAPETALYAGWYNLARYVDAFDWVRGGVGYHLASQECQTLKGKGRYWCKSILEDGAAATLGPVAEPYLQAFPVPELFFHFLVDGYYTLAESYMLSLPYLSWQMVLIGDPLYRPFKNR